MYDTSPTIFVPTPGVDNAPDIKALLDSGVRWIQISGANLRLDTPVLLEDDGEPANYVMIQPHPSMTTVIVDVSGIGRDGVDPTNPTFSGFEYSGKRTDAGYLSSLVAAGTRVLPVNDGALYTAGDWVNVSNASTNPGATLQPLDGAGAKYRIEQVTGNNLTIDRPTERTHPSNATVSKCKPLVGAVIENLTFTGDCACGVHVHDDINGTYRGIKTFDWTGRAGVLIDNWNIGTLIYDCFTIGTTPGTGLLETVWGVAIEGGSGTRYSRCGGTNCGAGLTVNYGYDVRGIDTLAYANNVNVSILTESIDCFDIRPRTAGALAVDTSESESNVNCAVVDRREATDAEMCTGGFDMVEWRNLTLKTVFGGTDTLLVADENGGLAQINPLTALIARNGAGAIESENIVIDSPQDYGGNLQLTNNLQGWAVGMLSSNPFRDFVIFNITAEQVDFRIGYSTGDVTTSGHLNLLTDKTVKVNAVQVVGARQTGWAVATGTATRTTFATDSVTLPELAERVKALIDDLHGETGHGLLGT